MGLMCPNHKSYQAVTSRENIHKTPTNDRAEEVVTIKLACGCIFPIEDINEYARQIKDVVDEAMKAKRDIDTRMRAAVAEIYVGAKKGVKR